MSGHPPSVCRTDAINGLVFTSFGGEVAGHGIQLCPMLDHFEELGQQFHLLDGLILVQRLPLTQRRSLRPFVAPDLVHLFGRKRGRMCYAWPSCPPGSRFLFRSLLGFASGRGGFTTSLEGGFDEVNESSFASDS